MADEQTPNNNLDAKQTATPSSAEGAPGTSPTPNEGVKPSNDDKTLGQIVTEAANASKVAEGKVDAPSAAKEGEPKVVDKKDEPVKDEATPEDKEKTDEPKAEDKPEEVVPFHDHPRWKEVTGENKQLKEQMAVTTAEVERLKPMAQTSEVLQQFCKTKGISQDDLHAALELAALAKTDIRAFQTKMTGYLDNIAIAAGDKLPPDLQQKLDDGKIDEEAAKELSLNRMRLKQTEMGTQSAQQQQAIRLHQDISNTIDTWEVEQKKTDPDFDKRRDLLQDRIAMLWQATPPATPAAAVKLAEQANKEVKERLNIFKPKAQPRKVLTTNGSSINKGPALKPLDNLDELGALVNAVARGEKY